MTQLMVCLPSMEEQETLGSIASTPGVVAHVTVESQSWGGEDRMIRVQGHSQIHRKFESITSQK